MSHSGKAPGKEAKKEKKERSPNLGGRRPGAGRPKGSKYGKRQHFMCYLNSEDAEKFERFAEDVDMSPYKVLKAFAMAAITDGTGIIDAAIEPYIGTHTTLRLRFHVGVDFDTTMELCSDDEVADYEEDENGVVLSSSRVGRDEQ